ncbi:hypothetical protein PYCC9005_001807 [Savitreella phatthalungensis]
MIWFSIGLTLILPVFAATGPNRQPWQLENATDIVCKGQRVPKDVIANKVTGFRTPVDLGHCQAAKEQFGKGWRDLTYFGLTYKEVLLIFIPARQWQGTGRLKLFWECSIYTDDLRDWQFCQVAA